MPRPKAAVAALVGMLPAALDEVNRAGRVVLAAVVETVLKYVHETP